MYRNILPYNIQRDRTHLQGHHDTINGARANRLRRLRQTSFKRAIHDGARRVRNALSRPDTDTHVVTRSMSWWD